LFTVRTQLSPCECEHCILFIFWLNTSKIDLFNILKNWIYKIFTPHDSFPVRAAQKMLGHRTEGDTYVLPRPLHRLLSFRILWDRRWRHKRPSSLKNYSLQETNTNTIYGREGESTAGCQNVHYLCRLYCTPGTQHNLSVNSPPLPQMSLVSISGEVTFFHDNGVKGHLLNILSSLSVTQYRSSINDDIQPHCILIF